MGDPRERSDVCKKKGCGRYVGGSAGKERVPHSGRGKSNPLSDRRHKVEGVKGKRDTF